ncbi:hypothetical protein J2W42_001693 [Rhizobium tibeticum]|nr:hypothetical protein [Rhizobium tibeticum]
MIPSTPSYPIRLSGVIGWLKADVKFTVSRSQLISITDQEQLVSRHQVMVPRMKDNRESVGSFPHLRSGYRPAVSTEIFTGAARWGVCPTVVGLVGIALCEKADRYRCDGYHGRY